MTPKILGRWATIHYIIVDSLCPKTGPNETRVELYDTFVVPVLLYGSECWCLGKEDERRICTSETRSAQRAQTSAERQHFDNLVNPDFGLRTLSGR